MFGTRFGPNIRAESCFSAALPPSLPWDFLFVGKGAREGGRESDCVSATVIIAIVSLSLSLIVLFFLSMQDREGD